MKFLMFGNSQNEKLNYGLLGFLNENYEKFIKFSLNDEFTKLCLINQKIKLKLMKEKFLILRVHKSYMENLKIYPAKACKS